MSLYDDLQPVVSGVMAEFKQGDVKYLHRVPGTGPEDDPGAATETTYSVSAAIRGAKFRYVQSGLALASDLQATIAVEMTNAATGAKTTAIVPTMAGFVIADGVRYKIVGIDPKPSVGTPVAYVLIIRK